MTDLQQIAPEAASLIGQNQPISRGQYGRVIRDMAVLPEIFIAANSARIDRAYAAGEPLWMIVDELKMIHSLGEKRLALKSPRDHAVRVVSVRS